MASLLEQLRAFTTVVSDTGDIQRDPAVPPAGRHDESLAHRGRRRRSLSMRPSSMTC